MNAKKDLYCSFTVPLQPATETEKEQGGWMDESKGNYYAICQIYVMIRLSQAPHKVANFIYMINLWLLFKLTKLPASEICFLYFSFQIQKIDMKLSADSSHLHLPFRLLLRSTNNKIYIKTRSCEKTVVILKFL